jgi:hypothetical protein
VYGPRTGRHMDGLRVGLEGRETGIANGYSILLWGCRTDDHSGDWGTTGVDHWSMNNGLVGMWLCSGVGRWADGHLNRLVTSGWAYWMSDGFQGKVDGHTVGRRA